MKALTIHQPWASLLACGAKKYETRSWATSYRGPIAIHAGKKDPIPMYKSLPLATQTAMTQIILPEYGMWKNVPLGAIIATAELVGCYEIVADTMCRSRILFPPTGTTDDEPFGHYELSEQDDEFLFGDWSPGRYAWEFTKMKRLDEPIPARGGQRIWNWEGNEHEG